MNYVILLALIVTAQLLKTVINVKLPYFTIKLVLMIVLQIIILIILMNVRYVMNFAIVVLEMVNMNVTRVILIIIFIKHYVLQNVQ